MRLAKTVFTRTDGLYSLVRNSLAYPVSRGLFYPEQQKE